MNYNNNNKSNHNNIVRSLFSVRLRKRYCVLRETAAGGKRRRRDVYFIYYYFTCLFIIITILCRKQKKKNGVPVSIFFFFRTFAACWIGLRSENVALDISGRRFTRPSLYCVNRASCRMIIIWKTPVINYYTYARRVLSKFETTNV